VNNIFYTLTIVIATVALTIALAYPLSLYLSFGKSRLARWTGKLYLIPRFVPGIVAVYAIMGVVRDSGALNRLFMQFGIDVKPSLMYTPQGIIIANLWFNIPFAIMLISAAMSGISPSLVESARDVGANSFRIFRRIIFPLTAKSALVASVFVFMGNIGSFTTPFLMGANAPRMLGVALYQEFSVFYNPAAAAALSTVMFLLSAAAGGVYIHSMMKEESWQK
jgi:ABC-type spermidine/putrescine transport system permease subunit I